MKQTSLIALLFVTISLTLSAKTTNPQGKLFLVGGGLKTCSSMATKNCNAKTLANNNQLNNAKTTALFEISKKTIKLIELSWPEHFDNTNKLQIINVLTTVSTSEPQQILSKSGLKFLLKKYDHHRIINKLNDAEYYFMLDLLEQPVLKPNTTVRLKEQVDLLNSTDIFSTEIYQHFVVLAQEISAKKVPKILVLTASARDPFEAVDFYQSAFTQAGGDTQWLPLDATLNNLIQQKGDRQRICQQLTANRIKVQGSINREHVYPDLTKKQLKACLSPDSILEQITQADGIFINGGDQSLTLKAFINKDGSDNKALKLIKEKLANNTLILGGTSAGTAVMSGGNIAATRIPMITNGQSNTAIVRGAKKDVLPQEGCQKSKSCNQDLLNDDLTYNSSGGLGLFPWGILDTHFSERGRQGRLAKLVLDTKSRFAFGVDETTALIVSNINTERPYFKVIGQAGVFIIENTINNSENNAVLSHYLTRDDTASLNGLDFQLQLAYWKKKSQEHAVMPEDINSIFKGDRYQLTTELLCRTDNSTFSATSRWRNTNHTVKVNKQKTSQSGYGVFSLNGLTKGYCSYQNYQLSIINN